MAREFTADQDSAIEYRLQDACVVAGPGSGKTTVLVERYRQLIEEHGFEPRQILAITFTEKAAANMKAKVAAEFAHDAQRLRELESAWVSTIHGFCARLLRENAIAAGIDPRFTVLDARQSEDLQNHCLNEALDELVEQRREEAIGLLEALQTPRIANDLKNAYDGIRSAGMTVEQVRGMKAPAAELTPEYVARRLEELLAGWPPRLQLTAAKRTGFDELTDWARLVRADPRTKCPVNLQRVWEPAKDAIKEFRDVTLANYAAAMTDRETARFRQTVYDVLARFDELYAVEKTKRGALDFNDLERRTIDLLDRNEHVQTGVREQFRQVMLDEFQDINKQQNDLIRKVRGANVFFAVGDMNQSIYGFRHARPEIFREYRDEVQTAGGQSASLLDNFRSRAEILRCVEALLNNEEGIERHTLQAGKTFAPRTEPSIEVLRVLDNGDEDGGDGMREARWIATRIGELRQEGFDFREFAVLCRSHDAMKPFLLEFDRVGIPYVCGRRQSFLLAREGLDITALLQTLANPQDGIALATVLRSVLVGIGDEGLLRIRGIAKSLTAGLNALAYDEARYADFALEDAGKLRLFTANLKRWRADRHVVPLDLLIVRMLGDCGFGWTPGTTSGDNVEAFLRLARTNGADCSLLDFLRELESIGNAVNGESELSDEDQGNAVQVMTAHAAKGLEFGVTIIAAMQKGTQRSGATVTFTPEDGLGLRWKDAANNNAREGKDGLKDSWALANGVRLKQREKEEENRLLYVAMTRAERHLILSYSHDGKRMPTQWAKRVQEIFNGTGIQVFDGFRAQVRDLDTDPPPLSVHAFDRQQSADVLTLPRPEITEQHETAVNVTALTTFAACPRKYYIQRYVGWNGGRFRRFDPEEFSAEGDDGDLSAADLGSAVHEILAGKAGEYPAEAHALASVFLASDLGRRAAASTRSAREWNFIAEMTGTLVRGSIDLWFEEGGEISLVDYKTDAEANPAHYAPQLALYAMALEKAFGKRPVRAYLHFLRSDTVVEVPLDDGSLASAQQLIEELSEAQDRFQFDLREGAQCRWCSFYRTLCPSGKREEEDTPVPGIAVHAEIAGVV